MTEPADTLQSPTQNRVEVTAADLPVHCPMSNGLLPFWHPIVYLPVEQLGHAKCPYCGTEFVLKEGESLAHGH